jgi:hypothetical protein
MVDDLASITHDIHEAAGVAAVDFLNRTQAVLAAELVPDETREPIERVDHDGLVIVRLIAEFAQGGCYLVVAGGERELVGGDGILAFLGGDEDPLGSLRTEGRFADALDALQQNERRLGGTAPLHAGK